MRRYAPLIVILNEILQSCQNMSTLESAHGLLRVLTSDLELSSDVSTAESLEEVLEEIGFGGLLRSSSFLTCNDQDRQCAVLTDKLIEVRAAVLVITNFLTRFIAHYCLKVVFSQGALRGSYRLVRLRDEVTTFMRI